MNKCIKNPVKCLGRDCRELLIKGQQLICCREEIEEEREIVQNIIDAIDECDLSKASLQRVSSKLSYAACVINRNDEEELAEILSISQRFSLLIYEFQEKILFDHIINELILSFATQLQRWFGNKFIMQSDLLLLPVHKQSIIADMNTIEMALGVCMLERPEESSVDDIFF